MQLYEKDSEDDLLDLENKEMVIEKLMDQYGEELKRLIYTYTKSWSQADDIIQDVFLKIFMKLETFSGDSSIRTWVYSIAINQCKDYKKSWYFRNIQLAEKIFSFSGVNNSTPEAEIVEKSDRDTLMAHVLTLPIKYREVILLYYYKDFSVEEISRMTELNISTVKTRLKRAREKLHVKMKGNRGEFNE